MRQVDGEEEIVRDLPEKVRAESACGEETADM
jgi:hypothetical protein